MKDGTIPICVDYWKLNQMTITDAYPQPRIESFTSLPNAYWIVALDLLIVYNQISVGEEDRAKSAFSTHSCLFVFNVMQFGLCNAPANVQRLIDGIFRNKIGKALAPYPDDPLMRPFATRRC